VDVEYNGSRSANLAVPVAPAAPGILTSQILGKGDPVIVNGDGSTNSATNPAKKGTYITFFGTGDGIPTTLGVDGRLAATAPYQTTYLPVTVNLNGAPVTPLYAGAAPGFAGLIQVNVLLPATLASGTDPLSLQVGTATSQTVNLYVQ
jgi:uncharacterized protein (TIGR03437 family)